MLNIVRILSKVSVNQAACYLMNNLGREFIECLAEVLKKYKDNLTILIRAAFVLGNMTSEIGMGPGQGNSRLVLVESNLLPQLFNIAS